MQIYSTQNLLCDTFLRQGFALKGFTARGLGSLTIMKSCTWLLGDQVGIYRLWDSCTKEWKRDEKKGQAKHDHHDTQQPATWGVAHVAVV